MKTTAKRIFSIVLLLFLAFWSLLGGYGFMADPTGASLGIPLEYLKNTPFDDYLIPGIILFSANGISAIIIALSVLRKVKNYPFFIMVQGMVLLLWLTIQLYINTDFYTPYLHLPFYTIAFLLLVFGAIIKVPKVEKP